jgi:hypothetical protein
MPVSRKYIDGGDEDTAPVGRRFPDRVDDVVPGADVHGLGGLVQDQQVDVRHLSDADTRKL